MAARGSHSRGLDPRDAGAQHQHAQSGRGGQHRAGGVGLGEFGLLEFGAEHGVGDAGDVAL
jgi:hypothetical protein